MAGISKSIDSMLKPELRLFLMARGMAVSNYTLAQLRELANKAVELGLPVLTTPDDTASFLLERCTVVVDNETVTFPVVASPKLKSWADNLSSLPMFCQADILVYLLGHASWSKERLKGFRKEKGYRLHIDGHVHAVELHSLTHDHVYVRAHCTRGTSQSEKAYLTWCLLERGNACIVSGGCECTGDDGACKHVVALLFSLVDWSDRHVDRSTETCTDVKCVWDIARKESLPLKLADINTLLHTDTINNYRPSNESCFDVQNALHELVKDTDCQMNEVLDNEHSNVSISLPKTMLEFGLEYKTLTISPPSFIDYVKFNMTNSDSEEINSLSQGQSDSENWFKYRCGRLTASVFPNVLIYSQNKSDNCIVKQVMSEYRGQSAVSSTCASSRLAPAMYGKEREVLARQLYECKQKIHHVSLNVNVPGLLVNENMPHLGASPDGVVHCQCCGKGLLEVKCTYKYKNCSIDKICSENYNVYKNENGVIKLKRSSPWFKQIQCQMAVANVQWCDFVLYVEGTMKTGKHLIYIDRIFFDQMEWKKDFQKITSFYESFIVPKLLS